MKLKANILSLSVTLLTLFGCSSNNCPLDNYVACNYHFYDYEGKAVTLLDTLTVKTLLPGYKTVYVYNKLGYTPVTLNHRDSSYIDNGFVEKIETVRRDTVLVNKLTNASSFQVPMSYFNAEDTLVFSYKSIILSDTIKVAHQSYPHVELPECGTYRFHNLRSINCTNRYIDRIEISNSKVNYEGKENVKIFFNPTEE